MLFSGDFSYLLLIRRLLRKLRKAFNIYLSPERAINLKNDEKMTEKYLRIN